MAFIWRGAT